MLMCRYKYPFKFPMSIYMSMYDRLHIFHYFFRPYNPIQNIFFGPLLRPGDRPPIQQRGHAGHQSQQPHQPQKQKTLQSTFPQNSKSSLSSNTGIPLYLICCKKIATLIFLKQFLRTKLMHIYICLILVALPPPPPPWTASPPPWTLRTGPSAGGWWS